MSNNINKNFLINFLIILCIFCVDRFSKIYVISFHEKNYGSDLYNSKFLNISLIWNEGIAFGLLSYENNQIYNFITILIILINFLIVYILFKIKDVRKYFFLNANI